MSDLTEYGKQSLLLTERFRELGLPGSGIITLEMMRDGLILVSMKGLQCSVLCAPDKSLEGPLNMLIRKRDQE